MSRIGQRGEILPAYNSETGERDIWDEITGFAAVVVRDLGTDLVCHLGNDGDTGEWFIAPARFRRLGGYRDE